MEIKPYIRRPQYYETDQMGIIHHANYIHWFEEARVFLLDQLGFSYLQVMAEGIDFPLLGLSATYKSMVRFGELIHIYCSFTALTPTRMTIHYRIMDVASEELRATGETQHCFFSQQRARPVSLKKEIPRLYSLFSEIYTSNSDNSEGNSEGN